MHFQCEIIMPAGEDTENRVKEVMAPYHEGREDRTGHEFWDFWTIGGRFMGRKLMDGFGSKRMDAFFLVLNERGCTVSSFQAGKQELKPTEQIPGVDALWREHFPDGGDTCPIFNHFQNPQWDTMYLGSCSREMKCARIIFARESQWDETRKEYEPFFMLTEDFYNGVNFEKAAWDKTLGHALELLSQGIKHNQPEAVQHKTPAPDWRVVTVDYHT